MQLPDKAAVPDRVAAQSPRPLGVAVWKKWVGSGSRRLASETLADGATSHRLAHNEFCTLPTAGTVAETTAGGRHYWKIGDGGRKGGRGREGLHWA